LIQRNVNMRLEIGICERWVWVRLDGVKSVVSA